MGTTASTVSEETSNPISEVQVLEGHKDRVGCLEKINSSLIASGADDGSIYIWDSLSGSRIFSLLGHTLPITCLLPVQLSKDKYILASGSSDRTVRIWDLQTGKCIHKLPGHKGSITCIITLKEKPNIICSAGNDR